MSSNVLPSSIQSNKTLSSDQSTQGNQSAFSVGSSSNQSVQFNIATYDLTLQGLTTNWGQIRGVPGSKNYYPSVIDIESVIPAPSVIKNPITILSNKAHAVIDVAVIRDNGIKNNIWAYTNPYVNTILNEGIINVDHYYNSGQLLNKGTINFRDWGKLYAGNATNGSNVISNDKSGKISFGANSELYFGPDSQQNFYNSGSIVFGKNMKMWGGKSGVPVFSNDKGKVVFDGAKIQGEVSNFGVAGDGSGFFGTAIFDAQNHYASGNLLPGTSDAPGYFSFQGYFSQVFNNNNSHEFDLFTSGVNGSLGSSDYLKSSRSVDLSEMTVLDLVWRGKNSISANSRFTIFKTGLGSGNLSGHYLNAAGKELQEGAVVDYVAKGSSSNVATKLYITYQGAAGSDVEIYTEGLNYSRGTVDADVITGTKGADVYQGLSGDDTLVASEGIDDYYGGQGADRFLAKEGEGYMVIHDFDSGEGDALKMSDGSHLSVIEDPKGLGSFHYTQNLDLVAVVHGT